MVMAYLIEHEKSLPYKAASEELEKAKAAEIGAKVQNLPVSHASSSDLPLAATTVAASSARCTLHS